MIHLTMSHRLDALAATLVSRLKQDRGSPFAAREIIVPSGAMQRYLSLYLADSAGICANVRFSYLAQWFWEEIRKVLPVAAESPYATDLLSWRIFHILGEANFIAAHPRLLQWLDRNDPAARHELATALASLFEQYLTYRPDWLLAWFKGEKGDFPSPAATGNVLREDEAWQAALWRRIEEETQSDGVHPARRFFEALQKDAAAARHLPARLSVFCLPAMAPQYLDMLQNVSEWVEVDLYVLNPCRELWDHVVSEKKLATIRKSGRETYHETGNALLAAWGRQSQSLLSLLMKLETDGDWLPADDAPAPSLLGCLQDSIHHLMTPELDQIASDDRSVEVHVCHSLLREVEVLHDQLLALFASDNPPLPCDIVVVTPNVDKAAPLVDAVFGNAAPGARIPYRIMGRKGSQTNPVARALVDILALAASRFTASDVYDLLLQPLVSKRFSLEEAADQVYAWLEEAGICWGLDGEQKTAWDLPVDDSRSFHDGFYRLFLAYALPQEMLDPFGSRLPAGNPEGSGAVLLGSLWHFVSRLRALSQTLATPKDSEGWREVLLAVMDDFICQDAVELEDDLSVRQTIQRLFDCMGTGGKSQPVDADVVRRALVEALDESTRGSVPSGVVTFTSMAGLRSLPCRIACAIGMDDGVFPADSRPLEFDLMAHAPRMGDMQRRDDDRNVFLDLLLAARERLYISYTGRNVRDDSSKPPSIVVSELLDTVARALVRETPEASITAAEKPLDMVSVADAEKAVRKRLVIEHPLQAFSRRYFEEGGDARIKSCHADFCRALEEKATQRPFSRMEEMPFSTEDDDGDDEARRGGTVFFSGVLPPPDASWHDVTLSDLVRFFENPSRFLLDGRMGVSFPTRQEELPSFEPFVADNLDVYRFADRVLPLLLNPGNEDKIMAVARAGNEFPPGRLGQIGMEEELESLERFANRIRGDMAQPCLPSFSVSLDFSLEGEKWTLDGALGDVRDSGLVRYRYVKASGNSGTRLKLAAWINHLFLNAVSPEGVMCRTVCHFTDETLSFAPCPPAEANSLLADLLALYRTGLNAPLRFFPASAQAFVEGYGNMQKARQKWDSNNDRQASESDDVFFQLAMRGQADPLDDFFAECANRVMAPMKRWTEGEKP